MHRPRPSVATRFGLCVSLLFLRSILGGRIEASTPDDGGSGDPNPNPRAPTAPGAADDSRPLGALRRLQLATANSGDHEEAHPVLHDAVSLHHDGQPRSLADVSAQQILAPSMAAEDARSKESVRGEEKSGKNTASRTLSFASVTAQLEARMVALGACLGEPKAYVAVFLLVPIIITLVFLVAAILKNEVMSRISMSIAREGLLDAPEMRWSLFDGMRISLYSGTPEEPPQVCASRAPSPSPAPAAAASAASSSAAATAAAGPKARAASEEANAQPRLAKEPTPPPPQQRRRQRV